MTPDRFAMTSDERLATPELSAEELRHRLDGLNRLLDVTRSLAAEIDLGKVLKTIITEVCAALDCERASLYQYDPATKELYTSVVSELEIAGIRRPADMGISGFVARHGVLANVPRPSQDARWNAAVDQVTGFQTRNILAVPLVAPHDGSLLGVLQLLNKRGGSFGKSDEALLVAFGQHAAVALDRARLVEEIKRRQATEASLDIARQVQRRFMPDKLPEIL
jgi:GAF domain-containing protein